MLVFSNILHDFCGCECFEGFLSENLGYDNFKRTTAFNWASFLGEHFTSILPPFITLWYQQRITPYFYVFILCHVAVFLLQSRAIIYPDENFPQKNSF